MSVSVQYEKTPNPHSLKFNVGQTISSESIFFDDPMKCQRSPLASKLFGFPWASAIQVGTDFVAVTKQDWVEWDVIADPLCYLIKEHLVNNEPVLLPEMSLSNSPDEIDESDSPTVKAIKEIINTELRPAVALDGGDISFVKYEDHKVYIKMLGACSGCPSSTITLKEGIEVRLKNAVSEIQEVISI